MSVTEHLAQQNTRSSSATRASLLISSAMSLSKPKPKIKQILMAWRDPTPAAYALTAVPQWV
jgi:hypothetical protein